MLLDLEQLESPRPASYVPGARQDQLVRRRILALASYCDGTIGYDSPCVRLKAHSKAKTPVAEVARTMKRTEGAVRLKAETIGIGLGHRR